MNIYHFNVKKDLTTGWYQQSPLLLNDATREYVSRKTGICRTERYSLDSHYDFIKWAEPLEAALRIMRV